MNNSRHCHVYLKYTDTPKTLALIKLRHYYTLYGIISYFWVSITCQLPICCALLFELVILYPQAISPLERTTLQKYNVWSLNWWQMRYLWLFFFLFSLCDLYMLGAVFSNASENCNITFFTQPALEKRSTAHLQCSRRKGLSVPCVVCLYQTAHAHLNFCSSHCLSVISVPCHCLQYEPSRLALSVVPAERKGLSFSLSSSHPPPIKQTLAVAPTHPLFLHPHCALIAGAC